MSASLSLLAVANHQCSVNSTRVRGHVLHNTRACIDFERLLFLASVAPYDFLKSR